MKSVKDKNTMDAFDFIVDHITALLYSFFGYWIIIFKNVKMINSNASWWNYFFTVIGITGILVALEIRRYRYKANIFFNLTSAYGIYTVVSYFETKKTLIIIIAAISLLLSFVSAYFIFCRKIKNKSKKRVIIRNRIMMSLSKSRLFFCYGMAVLIVCIGIGALISKFFPKTLMADVTINQKEDEYIEKHIDEICKFYQKTWEELSLDEKKEAVCMAVNLERVNLGIEDEISVSFEQFDQKTKGYYYEDQKRVVINLNTLENERADAVYCTVAHEVYHCYEHRMVEVYDQVKKDKRSLRVFEDIPSFKYEFANYTDGDENIIDYENQLVEEKARKYSHERVINIFRVINEHLGFYNSEDGYKRVTYDDNGNAYLVSHDRTRVAGPYKYIEEADWMWGDIVRYIGDNGLFGYVSGEGLEITSPKFIEASCFEQGIALVKENEDGGVYYINSDGERISQNFKYGYTFENYGKFARVITDDDKYALIDKNGDISFTADYITEIPYKSMTGSAVIDGKAVLFDLKGNEKTKCELICTLEDYVDISTVYRGKFAIVTNKDGCKGVVSSSGEVIIPADYISVEFDVIYGEKEIIIFKLQNEKHEFETFRYQTR